MTERMPTRSSWNEGGLAMRKTRTTMTIRILVFLSALSFFLLGSGSGLAAPQQDVGPAARKVIIFVWDGLRADDVTLENMPNYFALARSGSFSPITTRYIQLSP